MNPDQEAGLLLSKARELYALPKQTDIIEYAIVTTLETIDAELWQQWNNDKVGIKWHAESNRMWVNRRDGNFP